MNPIDSSLLFFLFFVVVTVALGVITNELRKIRELLEDK